MTVKSVSLVTEGQDSSRVGQPPKQLDLAALQWYARIPFLDQAAAATPSCQPYHIIAMAVQRLPHRTTNYNHLLPSLHPIPKSALIPAQPTSTQSHRAFTSPHGTAGFPEPCSRRSPAPTPYPGWGLQYDPCGSPYHVDHNTRSNTSTYPSPHLSAPILVAHAPSSARAAKEILSLNTTNPDYIYVDVRLPL
ncbi:hypothetical protein BJY52DRAFT_1213616 [Lactarius psammicola]|nr:hypothetical protein BJY52DRAFT_1213616 [Lactarius psammicola]